MRSMLSGHCHSEEHEATPQTAPSFHNRCAGAYPTPSGGLSICPCPRHAGEQRCRICRTDHTDPADYDVASRRCLDHDACTRRINHRVEQCATRQAIKEVREAVPTPRRTSRDCECGCGGTTRGGRFQPGHDAKLKSRLLALAKQGDEDSILELKERKWMKA